MLDKNIPGPGKFNISKPFGHEASKFSICGKGADTIKRKSQNEPGPGDYKLISMNKEGIYPLSNFTNTSSISFSLSKEQRFNYESKNIVPAPNKYDIKSLIDGKGFIFSSKYKSSNANSLVGKGKDLTTKFTNYKTPGPGSYTIFSEFGIYEGGLIMNKPIEK
jgi:hypothetical protein